jgi:hypothetical protein
MPKLKPQTRFLMRGSALLVGLLSLWWFLLLSPMLYMLKGAAGVFLPIQENASGDWTLRVPLERTLPATPQQPVAQQIHSIDFDMPRGDATAFTFSLPVYWAIILAAPGVRRNLRPLLVGTAVMAAVELAMLLVFAEISARNTAAQLAGGGGDVVAGWARLLGDCAPLRHALRGGALAASRIARGDLPLEQRRGSASAATSRGSRPTAAREEAPALTCLHWWGCFSLPTPARGRSSLGFLRSRMPPSATLRGTHL